MRSPRFEPPRTVPSRMSTLVLVLAAACTGPSACIAQATAESPPAASSAVDPGALSKAIESLARRIAPAVVQVQVKGYAPVLGGEEGGLLARRSGAGSGVILDPAGYIVTNAHVIEGARSIQVELAAERRTPAGTSILKTRGRVLGAQLVGVDRETDLAVLKVEAAGLPALQLGDSESLAPG